MEIDINAAAAAAAEEDLPEIWDGDLKRRAEK